MLEIGSIIDGKYKILNKIGQGGMSVVYLAMNERANKQWAIKEVRKDGTKDYEVVKQGLIAETDILKRLNHPHLPSIIDVIDCDDTFLIVMDYIEGRTLDHWLKKEGAQPQERVVEWAKQICDVLGYLHSRKPPIIYRDLKPSNVMLKPDGKIMIIDFGTAREFKEQSIEDTKCLGTQGYAAPEQYGGHGQTDARTDIYNLGATMYHLLTGHNPSLPPYEMYPIRQWNPSLSSGLEAIVTKCTQRNPNDRYQSCAELMYALEHYDELDIEYRKQQKRKWGAFLAACSLTAVSLIGCLGFKFAENSTIKNSYDGYLRAASNAATQEEKVDYYRDAINLDPSRGDAWLSLLDVFIDGTGTGDGGLFTQEEDVQMKEILGYTGSGNRTNESYLESNPEAYDEFSFQMGLAYFYYYGEEGNKPMSQSWFETAAESDRICDVLGYLHSRKPPIIYRDLKPSNVMLKPDGKIMIIDFGTAREFKEQSIEDTKCLGTQGYAAPEQYGGHGQTDARTDIYNLGATMYHLLTGHNPSLPPYEMYPIRQWNPSLSSGLEAIVTKCTQRNPNDRYQSCAELMYALEHYDELDIEYRKQQKRKWGAFLAACSLTAVSLIGCLGFKFAENSTIKNSYDGYLRAASNAATQEEKVDYYRDAINLDPSRGDAWLSLLDVFIDGTGTGDGGLFTQEEDVQMKEILGYTGSGNRTNESYLESNPEAYDEFSFQMGLAYFYYYGEEGNKPMSQSWFETAAESDSLEPNKVERAKRFAKIAGYSQGLDTRDLAGDSEVSYADYWDDMVELTSGDLTAIDNEQTALVMYKEMVYQIYKNALNFRQAGVTEREMMDELQNIRSTLMSGFATDEVSGTKNEILASIDEAETQVNAAFSSQAGQTGGETDAGN